MSNVPKGLRHFIIWYLVGGATCVNENVANICSYTILLALHLSDKYLRDIFYENVLVCFLLL